MPEDTQKSSATPSNALSAEDIERLIKSPFEKKVDITQKIAAYYSKGGFDESQMNIAQTIFRTLIKDTEVEVRKALSEAVKEIDTIPHDVIMGLAEDVEDVSLPILEFSDVLTDADLIEIVTNTEDVNKQKSISRRKEVSTHVSEVLVGTGNEEVVGALLGNEGAKISNESYAQIVEDFSEQEDIMGSVVQRDTLPVEVMERLAEKVSKAVYSALAEKHSEAFAKMETVLKQSREVATMKMIGMRSSKNEYYHFRQLMDKLHISDDLAPIYALCMGNLGIFEVCVARITSTPVLNVRTLMADRTNLGLRALYSRAGLPTDLYDEIEVLVEVLREMGTALESHGIYISDEMGKIIIDKMLTRAQIKAGELDKIDYIISLIRNNTIVLDNG